MSDNCIIIFTGFNQRAVIAFIRTLEFHHLKYAIIAISDDDPIFDTVYREKVISIRQAVQLNLSDIINSIEKVKNNIAADDYVIAPSTEALNRFMLENRAIIESAHVKIPLTSKATYELISDKYSFGKLCQANGINVPKEYADLKNIPYPFLAKPKQFFSESGTIYSPFIIKSEADLQNFLSECNPADFYFQKFIDGKSYYLLYYFNRNNRVYKFSQQNLVQQPNGKSIIAAVSSTLHQTKVSLKFEQLFKSLNFVGLVMVEVIQQNNHSYMIEANPRFWGPSQLFVDAEMNFFEAFLHDLGILEKVPTFVEPQNESKYLWFGGIIETNRAGKKLVFHQDQQEDLIYDLTNWLQIDVYNRPDTLNIFKNEFF